MTSDPLASVRNLRYKTRPMPYTVTLGQKISDAIGGRIGLGERLGIERLIYNPLTFRNFHRVALYDRPGRDADVSDDVSAGHALSRCWRRQRRIRRRKLLDPA